MTRIAFLLISPNLRNPTFSPLLNLPQSTNVVNSSADSYQRRNRRERSVHDYLLIPLTRSKSKSESPPSSHELPRALPPLERERQLASNGLHGGAGAITSIQAAEIYGLNVHAEQIQILGVGRSMLPPESADTPLRLAFKRMMKARIIGCEGIVSPPNCIVSIWYTESKGKGVELIILIGG
ncbi:hypothetical protein V8G54_020303 [Vigna mungo]|uniref:Uncharacterized protein n=1 Tax=Vigna mungo TaxID=3915 RepID=A0AAQ3NC17_VIGMU